MEIQVKSAKEALINEVFFDKNTKKVSYKDKNGVITIVNQDAPSIEASTVPYDNTSSGLSSTEVQSAIDEVVTMIPQTTTTVVNISSAQILAMHTTPIELLPQSGANKYYDIEKIIFEYTEIDGQYGFTSPPEVFDYGFYVINGIPNLGGEYFGEYFKLELLTYPVKIVLPNKIYANDFIYQAVMINGSVVLSLVSTNEQGDLIDGENGASLNGGSGTLRAIITYTLRTFGA